MDYYRNLSKSDFEDNLPLRSIFSEYRFWYLPTHFDLYFAGVRAGDGGERAWARLPDDAAVEQLRSLMPWQDKAFRVPLRVLSKIIPEPRYQSLVLPYWLKLLSLDPEQQSQ